MMTRQWIAVIPVALRAMFVGACLLGWNSARSDGAPPRNAATVKKSAGPVAGDIDLNRSRVYVFVGKARLGHEHAVEGQIKSGNLRLKQQQPAGSIEFDMTSFNVDTPAARAYLNFKGETAEATRQKTTDNMLSADVLDVGRYPTATFKVQSAELIKNTKGTQQRLKGQFTLHGVTRDLTIVADATSDKGYVHLRGQFEILQSDYGIKPFKAALGAVGVADRLTIYGDLWIKGEEAP